MKVLVIGATGQLARELDRATWPKGLVPSFLGRNEADLSRPDTLPAIIRKAAPSIVINAAAHTAVDKAESEPDLAMTINGEAPGLLAEVTASLGIPLVHISTDYVFDGSKASAYVETDPIAPIGVYGASKAEGEKRIRSANPRHAILRTAWVFSPFGHNFVRTMLRIGRERSDVRVVTDQIGTPTAASDLAHAVISAVPQLLAADELFGTYHVAGTGETSWYGFAQVIFADMERRTGKRPHLTPIRTAEYPTAAKRPANSRLDTDAFFKTFGLRLPHWQTSVALVLDELWAEARA